MSTTKSSVVWIYLFWCSSAVLGQFLNENDPCQTNSGFQGICKQESDCSELNRERQLGRMPTLCGFQFGVQILCCPISNSNNNGNPFENPRPQSTQPRRSRLDEIIRRQGIISNDQPNRSNGNNFGVSLNPPLRPTYINIQRNSQPREEQTIGNPGMDYGSNFGVSRNSPSRPTNINIQRNGQPREEQIIGNQGSTINNQPIRRGSRVSEEKCKQYSRAVSQDVSILPLMLQSSAINTTRSTCVYDSSVLIMGGKAAKVGEFPHMAAIGYNISGTIRFHCGGSLISENYVLTAAHCTYNVNTGEPVLVRLGDHDIDRTDDKVVAEDFGITSLKSHPNYKSRSKYHDIALLQLSRQVTFSDTIRPACLWQTENIPHARAVATGWGDLAYKSNIRSSILQKVALNIIDHSRCSDLRVFSPTFSRRSSHSRGIIREQLCAGNLEEGGVDSCQGDSGGPLQVTNSENRCIFYIAGVTSYGVGCGNRESPGVYTRVSSYIDWIEGIVWSA